MKHFLFSLVIIGAVPCGVYALPYDYLDDEDVLPKTTIRDTMQVDPRDQVLEKKVKEKLNSGMFAYKFAYVQSKVVNGTVILNGTVRSASEKLEVEKRVKEVTGIKSVINRIEVTSIQMPVY